MPVLPIADSEGRYVLTAPAAVLAVSMYPDEKHELQRKQLVANLIARMLIELPDLFEEEDRAQAALELLPIIAVSPEPLTLFKKAGRHAQTSWVAGEMLLMMISAVKHHPELEVSTTKVVSVLCELFQNAETWGGDTIDLRPRTAWRAWSRFKSVAHLHAVRQIWLKNQRDEGVNDVAQLDFESYATFEVDQLGRYLAIAEFFRTAAVERQILAHESTWRVPENVGLVPADLEVPPLPDPAIAALAEYLPEHSKDVDLKVE